MDSARLIIRTRQILITLVLIIIVSCIRIVVERGPPNNDKVEIVIAQKLEATANQYALDELR